MRSVPIRGCGTVAGDCPFAVDWNWTAEVVILARISGRDDGRSVLESRVNNFSVAACWPLLLLLKSQCERVEERKEATNKRRKKELCC